MKGIPTRPEMEFKVGAVRAAVWSNPQHASDGRSYTTHKVLVERIYKDSAGTFKTTSSLDTNDIPKAILALKKAYEYITAPRPAAQQTGQPEEGLLHIPPRIP